MPVKTRPLPEKGLGRLTVLQRLNEYEFGVELWIMRSGRNQNNWDFRNMDEYYLSFVGCPILCAYVGRKIGDGHNMREVRDPKTGEKRPTFTDGTAERIVGTLSDDPKDFTLVERDGHTWITAKGRLFSFYSPELVEKIVQTGSMDVSAETMEKESHMEGNTSVITKWTGLGVTILGDDVDPAIPGAHIATLAAMQKEFKEVKLLAAQYRDAPGKRNNRNDKNKGVNKPMNKQAMSRLEPKFAGYSMVCLSEDEMHAILVNAAGETFSYSFDPADKGEVLLARVKPAAPVITFSLDGDTTVQADLADVLDPVLRNAKADAEKVKALQAELEEAKNSLLSMQTAEHKRRVELVKSSLEAEAARITAAEPDIAQELEESKAGLLSEAESFSGMESDGAFCGEQRACAQLRSRAMELHLASAEKAAQMAAPAFVWDTMKAHKPEAGSIEEMLAEITR